MRTEYLVSNEVDYPLVGQFVARLNHTSGVYVGVGPEQNYSFIAATTPAAAFIIDYRRENLLLHALFRSLLELADSRSEYLALLLSKPLSESSFPADPTLTNLIVHCDRTASDLDLFQRTLGQIKSRVLEHVGDVTENDFPVIEQIYRDFRDDGLDLRCRFPQYTSRGKLYPTYRDFLMSGAESQLEGRHFLADDAAFNVVKQRYSENRILCVKGDYAGLQALTTVGRFCSHHSLKIGLIYVSSVEYRLMKEGVFDQYVRNCHIGSVQSFV